MRSVAVGGWWSGGGVGQRALGVFECGQVTLGVECGGTTAAGRGDRLAVGVVDQIATGEDTGQLVSVVRPCTST